MTDMKAMSITDIKISYLLCLPKTNTIHLNFLP